jgi:hypothetical protein
MIVHDVVAGASVRRASRQRSAASLKCADSPAWSRFTRTDVVSVVR